MSDHLNIEELFRSKLEDAEITPSKGVWRGVQRKLKFRQMLRFDPGRFNLWYAVVVLVAGTAAVTLLNRVPGSNREESGRAVIEVQPAEERVSSTGTGDGPAIVASSGEDHETVLSAGSQGGKIEKGDEAPGSGQDEQQVVAPEKPEAAEVQAEPVTLPEAAEPDSDLDRESATDQLTLVPWFTASVTEGCAPLTVTFINTSANATSVSWNFGSGDGSEEMNPVHLFEEPGTYAVSMNVTGSGGQTGAYHQVIRVFPTPVAGFEIGDGMEEADGTRSMELMNYATGGYTYSWELLRTGGMKQDGWSSNEFQPTLNSKEIPDDTRSVRMVVMNEQGCTDTAIAEITAMDGAQRRLTFPTAFSASHTGPNGGLYNQNDMRVDVFHPHYTEEPAEYHLQLFSKMGEIVFETRDIHQGWDGYYMQERAAGGVYLWIAEGTWPNGASFALRGDVTLLWSDRR